MMTNRRPIDLLVILVMRILSLSLTSLVLNLTPICRQSRPRLVERDRHARPVQQSQHRSLTSRSLTRSLSRSLNQSLNRRKIQSQTLRRGHDGQG